MHAVALAQLSFRASAGLAAAAGAAVESIGATAGVDAERLDGVRAVTEALLTEACERPCADADADVTVRVGTRAGRLEVEVHDLAEPLSPAESRHAPSRRLAADGLVDELHIAAHGREGNVARFAIHRHPPPGSLAEERVADDAPVVSDEQAAAVEIRRMEERDARELVRCVYRCYGYSYKDPLLYSPREIAAALRSGAMTSVVAADPSGAVVGHAAVFFESAGDPIPESGKMIVDPRYRGHGIAGRLAERRLEVAHESGLVGFWSEAVTNHVASQREVIAAGGVEVGLLIGASPPAVEMVGFDNLNRGRRTLLAMFTTLRRAKRTIHVPQRHAELIAELAARLKAKRTIETQAGEATRETSVLTSSVHPDVGNAHLRVHQVGADLATRVADELEGLDAFELGAIHLDLPLADPGAVTAIDSLERFGFSFAAWIPKFDAGADVMRLQRVGGHPVETERVLCAREEGERLRDYVLADWHRVRRAGAT
jgi:GNAT superfamily N-acetyltransferase